MKIKNINKKAFSLLEVLLAAIIFVVSVAGIFATISAVRTPVSSKEGELTAAIFSKQVLETLRSQVSEQSVEYFNACSNLAQGAPDYPCNDFALSVGTHLVPNATLTAFGLSWPYLPSGQSLGAVQTTPNSLSYTVTCANGGSPCPLGVAHMVRLNICVDTTC